MEIWVNNLASAPGTLSCREGQKTALKKGPTLFIVACSLLFVLSSCSTTKLPKTPENSRPTKTTNESATYKKYSEKLGITVDKNSNLKLLQEVIDWWGTPYKYGGESKSGTDCSGFVQMVFLSVYNKQIPRSSKQQHEYCKKINKNQLKEGDLVFFDTSGKGISHVGIYLRDEKFAHASTKRGVTVNGLDEEYYVKAYRASGRVE